MGFTEPEIICKKHPNHKQQPGVCSSCLREKLNKLSTSTTTIMPLSLSSSSTSSSNFDSPRGGGHRRITSDVVGPFSFVSIIGAGAGAGGGLKKSRSIAFVARSGCRSGGLNGQKKKEGFWSKLIRSTAKRSNTVLVH
ncbi:uncharacterized protein LOC107774624 [Nicotiana tabacum]|uniref:Uncharacterized protein LOC107774624 n=2 Tax=Nicotiana TaxID=4085 RepID=A0A1S3YBR7_TOBAC|nr:PREDICTED: uncharacterized protein LOC104235261 [Nicotiana sylvestris]XP_016449701.1 PREDICTED: uncharacterized protein LOC107774624 [Nicotiana tabacum]